MKIITFTVLMLLCNVSYAIQSNSVDQAGFSQLTPVQQAEILKAIADKAAEGQAQQQQAKEAAKKPEVATVDELQKWVNLSASIGKGFAEAARELGITANEFDKTPVGIITATLVVWNFVGHDIVAILSGLLIIVVGLICLRRMFNTRYTSKIEYSPTETTLLGKQKIISIERDDIGDNYWVWYAGGALVLIIGTAIMAKGV